MDLQLRHLRTLLSVADELHFGRAAARLGLPQPTVSRQVRELEAALGVPLFVRTSRSTALTPAGRAVLDPARATLAAAASVATAAEAASRPERGEVAIGFMASTVTAFLPPLVQRLAAERPEVTLRVAQSRMDRIADELRDGRLDLAVARPLRGAPGVQEELLATEPMLLAVPADHRFARCPEIPPAALDGEPLVTLARAIWAPGHDALLAALAEAGARPVAIHEAGSVAGALALVAGGRGVFHMAASGASPLPGVVWRPVTGARSRIVLARRLEPASPKIEAVAAVIRSVVAAGVDQGP